MGELIDKPELDQSFRNSVATIGNDGNRVWIYPQKPKGAYYNKRSIVSIVFLVLLFGLPFIKIYGHPLILLNVLERKFIIFGLVFWPQDFPIFGLAMLTFVVFIVLFTVVFGRFMEMVFRKIENWIEGNSVSQKKLDAMPWNTEKILKKGSKHLIFYLISFLIANTFLAYIIGSDALIKIITEPIGIHMVGFIAIIIFTFVFYLVFAKLREIVCIIICPYGRLQGVMLDPNSVVVAYDYKRGEPRGKIRKSEEQTDKGDCIDCGLCIDVCPTAIDIRNGTQLECINCAACIDACNPVMEKINKPQGLIRFDSVTNIEKGTGFKWTPRMIGYSVLLIVLTIVLGYILATRQEIDASVLRSPGSNFTTDQEGYVTNIYNLELVNKTFEDTKFDLVSENKDAKIIFIDADHVVLGGEVVKRVFLIKMPQEAVTRNNTNLKLSLYTNGKFNSALETSFLGPIARLK